MGVHRRIGVVQARIRLVHLGDEVAGRHLLDVDDRDLVGLLEGPLAKFGKLFLLAVELLEQIFHEFMGLRLRLWLLQPVDQLLQDGLVVLLRGRGDLFV